MADKPLYYGGGSNMPQYYAKSPAYGEKPPMYYGSSPAYYGKPYYGGPSAYNGGNSGDGDGSLVGKITITRMLRVISQRWLSVFVFLLVGLVASFAVYRISPTIYCTSSQFTLDMRRSSGGRGSNTISELTPDYGTSYGEIFNTRISEWRSDKIVTKIIQQYRSANPVSTVTDGEIIGVLGGSSIELQRNSRLISITVRSKDPKLAAALANAYAEAIENFTDEENKLRCDKAVSQIHANVEKHRREVDQIAKKLLDFRAANKVDNLRSIRETTQTGYTKITSDILQLESEEAQLIEWEKLLAEVQHAPENFGSLAAGVPKAQEIASEYRAFQDASGVHQALLLSYTENHPEVIAKKNVLEMAKKRFLDAASRALLSSRSSLQVVKNQLVNKRARQAELRNELASVEQNVVLAESGLAQLNADYTIANDVLKGLILDENKARLEAEANNEIVHLSRQAGVPSVPVEPKPTVIFGAGVALSLALGILFVLIIDNLEDTIVNMQDIEQRLSLKVLVVLPHVRRKKREQVARFVVDEKYSLFSESIAAFRNLLDSPRYEALSKCMMIISTQPGEGKTITSCSIASAYAQSGRKTLLVDFDLRRPRQARIWNLELTTDRSFSHVLQSAGPEAEIDFTKLVNPTGIKNLDVIASLPPEGVTPATILGSSIVGDFFEWARTNYDRIIVDSPPYGLVGDVISLAVMVDSSIIMCCPDRTHFKPIQYCARCLIESGANILGVVVNDVETSSSSAFSPHRSAGGHYGGYHAYGGSYGYGDGYGYGYLKKEGESESSFGHEDAKAASEELTEEEFEKLADEE